MGGDKWIFMKFLVKPEAIKIAKQFESGSFSVNIDLVVLQEILSDEHSRNLFIQTFNDNLGVKSNDLQLLNGNV